MIEIREGKNGKMVCTTEPIVKGAIICRFQGKPVDYLQTLELGNQESFALQIGSNAYLLLEPPYRYFNHACEPNCGLTPELELISLKNIDKDDELRYDYSTTMLERHWAMKCACGSPSCRKQIADFDTLPKATQDTYLRLGIVQDFIVKRIRSLR